MLPSVRTTLTRMPLPFQDEHRCANPLRLKNKGMMMLIRVCLEIVWVSNCTPGLSFCLVCPCNLVPWFVVSLSIPRWWEKGGGP